MADWSWIPRALGALFTFGLDLATKAGQRDTYIAACDASLAAARAQTDRDLAAKHGR